jgi:prepilin-type N-terminal cleavage/methylation domain-containing protein
MLRLKSVRRSQGFTLIELLTVIAVIGILAVILIPTVGSVQDRARKTAAASKLRKIHTAYLAYTTDGSRPRTINATNIYDWARILAENADFNDPEIYLVPEDPLLELEESFPVVIATPPSSGTGDWSVHTDFANFPLSFAVVNRLSTQAPAATPLAWTRGLGGNGLWSEADGVYGTEGGHILRFDGSVSFYEDLNKDGGQLLNYTTKQPTGDISQAVSPRAQAFDYSGIIF